MNAWYRQTDRQTHTHTQPDTYTYTYTERALCHQPYVSMKKEATQAIQRAQSSANEWMSWVRRNLISVLVSYVGFSPTQLAAGNRKERKDEFNNLGFGNSMDRLLLTA